MERLGDIEDLTAWEFDITEIDNIQGVNLFPNLSGLDLSGTLISDLSGLEGAIIGHLNLAGAGNITDEQLGYLSYLTESLYTVNLDSVWFTNVDLFFDHTFVNLFAVTLNNALLENADCPQLLQMHEQGLLGNLHHWQIQSDGNTKAPVNIDCYGELTDVTANFPDESFKALVRRILGVEGDNPIYRERLYEIIEVYSDPGFDGPIEDISGIELISNPRSINLMNNNISDLSPFAFGSFGKLQELFLDENPIDDITPLTDLSRTLYSIGLSYTLVSDVSIFSGSDSLGALDIHHMRLDNVDSDDDGVGDDCFFIIEFNDRHWFNNEERWLHQYDSEDNEFQLTCFAK